MKLLFILTISSTVGCIKQNQNTVMNKHADQTNQYLEKISADSQCRKEQIDNYVEKCSAAGSYIYIFLGGNLIMCNKRPYEFGALSLTTPGDPLVKEGLGIQILCEGSYPLYFNPS